jgi:phage tail-like protein
MPPTSSTDGVGIASRFTLTVDDVDLASFSELVGITSEADPDSITAMVMKKLPGKRNPPTVILKRGLSRDLQLAAWHDSVIDGQLAAARKSCSLVMYDAQGQPVARYHLEAAWPSKLEVGSLPAGSGEVVVETVTLTCDRVQRVAP